MDFADPLGKMTTIPEFREHVLATLKYLDDPVTGLPMGSHVLFMGIVDGRILWNSLHNRSHPLRSDVTYEMLYDWLLCEKANP
jgi:acyloxyacyl hydrolase